MDDFFIHKNFNIKNPLIEYGVHAKLGIVDILKEILMHFTIYWKTSTFYHHEFLYCILS